MDNKFYIQNEYVNQIEVSKSKFISILKPLESLDDIDDILNDIKLRYPKARHYIYAYIFDEKLYYTDNGEPSNTAGKPTFDVLKGNNLNRAILITIRYFGGVLLGASNLLRTYLKCAKEVCLMAKLYKLEYTNLYQLVIGNEDFKVFNRFIANNNGNIKKIFYNGDIINFSLQIDKPIDEMLYLKSLNIIGKNQLKIYKEEGK